MTAIMLETCLATSLPSLSVRTAKQQVDRWRIMKTVHQRTSLLIRSLGKPAITTLQAKRLDVLGLNREALVTLHKGCSNSNLFLEELRVKGVKSKKLREKLSVLLPKLVKQE